MFDPEDKLNSDDDLRCLFQRTAPRSKQVDLDELLAAAEFPAADERCDKSTQNLFQWRKLIKRRSLLGAVGLAGCLAFGVMIWELAIQPDIAFSQVQAEVEAAQTVRFLQSRTDGGEDSFASRARMFLVEAQSEQKSIRNSLQTAPASEKADLEEKLERITKLIDLAQARIEQHSDKPWAERIMILGKHQQRVESPGPESDHITITNMKTGKIITIDPLIKEVQILNQQVTIDEKTGVRTESDIQPNPAADFFSAIRDVPENATKLQQTKTIDGVEVVGFQTVEQDGSDTWTRTFWVDPDSKLPKEIHTKYRSSNPRHGSSDWILSDIQFNVPLDADLFSTDPPPGYSVRESKIFGITPAKE